MRGEMKLIELTQRFSKVVLDNNLVSSSCGETKGMSLHYKELQ